MAQRVELESERQRHKAAISTALDEDEDPLAAYEQFVQWIISNYGFDDPDSGLLDLLEETTRQFKDDDGYKGTRRYLDLWIMYANLVDDPVTVYSFLVENNIGTSFCLLYEQYTKVLEKEKLASEAERIYRLGIKRRARPFGKLKKLHQEFLGRHPSLPSGKRREKLRVKLSLFMTEEGVEYSGPEARARSMGLLGKKWGPPPALSLPSGEPTVTINTKEALADVFGMFNSPDKTARSALTPGSKHAPVRKVEPRTPSAMFNQTPKASTQAENVEHPVTPGFRPFVGENAPRKENARTPFKPFVDSDAPKTPFITPDVNRRVLSLKETKTPVPVTASKDDAKLRPRGDSEDEPNLFSRVFTPKTTREKSEDVGNDQDEREEDEEQEELEPQDLHSPIQPFLPLRAAGKYPDTENRAAPSSRVFSRPLPHGENSFVPKRGGSFSPFVDASGDCNQEASPQHQQFHIPLGGRFGQFNIMTPITERTVEYTSSTRIPGTPDDDSPYLQHESDDGEMPIPALRINKDFADALTLKSSFKPPNPCNAFDSPIVTTLLSMIPTDGDFYDLRDRDAKLLDSLRRFAQKRRKSNSSTTVNLTLDRAQSFPVSLVDRRLDVADKLGEGGFGLVFAAKQRVQGNDASDVESDEDVDDNNSFVALKIVKPTNLWEYHVLRRLHASLPPSLRRSVITPRALYAFRDESFLLLDLCPQGTLLNVVNRAAEAGVGQQGACLDEMLVIFFTTELIRLLEGMHSAGFIHGDLKIDNCLLRLEEVPGGPSAWSNVYQPSGQAGWSYKGIKLIDFGRTIDTQLFPPGQTYIAEWPVDARDCPEMREKRPWTYQPDYFGLAGIIYCMLFGKYIETASVVADGGRLKISDPFKRYWQNELWTKLFDLLLNPCLIRPGGVLPLSQELRLLREEMEGWLERHSNRAGNTLKALLKKVEKSVL